MKLGATIVGDLKAVMADEVRTTEQAVTTAIDRAGSGLQREWRGAVSGALGRRLGNAVRFNRYPAQGTSLDAAAYVFVRPGKGGRGGAADIVSSFDEGTLIRRGGGRWLAIPTENTPLKARGRRATPADLESATKFGGFGRDLELVPTNRPGVMLLVMPVVRAKNGRGIKPATPRRLKAGRQQDFVVMFILVRQVQMPKRFDLQTIAEQWGARLPAIVVAEMERVGRDQ